MTKSSSIIDRFWKKVDRRSDDDCWNWLGCKDRPNGYGTMYVDGRHRRATRISWEMHNRRPFPSGMDACHTCDNPACVNPRHIWPGTRLQNVMDAVSKGRQQPPVLFGADHPQGGKTHCKLGHAFTEENTRITTKGFRECRACRQMLRAKYAAQDAAIRALPLTPEGRS
ncbi:MAG: HNH endonuclease [Afipia sp.]|nr:HNH endonuclease [Afipia sp.]